MSKTSRSRPGPARGNNRACVIVLLVGVVGLVAACALGLALYGRFAGGGRPAEGDPRVVTLRVAYSPEKEAVFTQLVQAFADSDPRLPEPAASRVASQSWWARIGMGATAAKSVRIAPVPMTPREMIAAAPEGAFDALSPDSSIWLGEIDRVWREEQGHEAPLVGETVRYMVSPVVIAMWRPVAEGLGYPERALGWADLLRAAEEQPDFKWSHPATQTAAGFLATLAQFYVATGSTRGLTEEMARAEDTLAYVMRLEGTVRHYGEGEAEVMQRIAEQGPSYLDALVVQEQWVVAHNLRAASGAAPELVAIYPAEGTLWEDHPLALLEHPTRTDEQRVAFRLFQEFLLRDETQRLILEQGYRPGDLNVSLRQPGSPISAQNGADPSQPYTTLQIPAPSVIAVVQDVWLAVKRHANIYLVVDISSSMRGAKIEDAQVALQAFLAQIQGDLEQVGLITFASEVEERVPLTPMGEGRARLTQAIDALSVSGNTALIDGVAIAFGRLRNRAEPERINAIVVMTDGIENRSRTRLSALTEQLREASRSDLPVLVFCIAYGGDADYETLRAISDAAGGFTERGDLETIQRLYEALSTYF